MGGDIHCDKYFFNLIPCFQNVRNDNKSLSVQYPLSLVLPHGLTPVQHQSAPLWLWNLGGENREGRTCENTSFHEFDHFYLPRRKNTEKGASSSSQTDVTMDFKCRILNRNRNLCKMVGKGFKIQILSRVCAIFAISKIFQF